MRRSRSAPRVLGSPSPASQSLSPCSARLVMLTTSTTAFLQIFTHNHSGKRLQPVLHNEILIVVRSATLSSVFNLRCSLFATPRGHEQTSSVLLMFLRCVHTRTHSRKPAENTHIASSLSTQSSARQTYSAHLMATSLGDTSRILYRSTVRFHSQGAHCRRFPRG